MRAPDVAELSLGKREREARRERESGKTRPRAFARAHAVLMEVAAMPAPSPLGDREVERLRLGLRDSLADHGAYMAKLRDVEAALLAGLSSAAAARIAPLDGLPTPPSRPLEAAERRERRKRRKRNRRRRIRRGGAAADSLSDGSLTTGSDSDSDGDLELERANELDEDELLDDISEEPAPAEPRVELRAPDAEAAYQRGCALWDAGFRVPPQGSECGRGFDVYRALSALLASGSAARSELAERLGEALGVPPHDRLGVSPPYGVRAAEVATLRLVHSGLCAGANAPLRKALETQGLETTGTKDELVARIEKAGIDVDKVLGEAEAAEKPKTEPKGQKDVRNALADRSKKKSAEKKELVSRIKSIDELLDQKPALHVPAADDVEESTRLLRRWHRGGAEGKAAKTRFRLTVQPVAGGEAAAIGEHRSGLSPCVI